MNPISVIDAFGNAPPNSPCVLCMKGEKGSFVLQMTEWFTWLNIKRNPMLSFSMPRGGEAAGLREGDHFVLAFPPAEEVLRYRQPVRAEQGTEPPVGTVSAELDGLTIPVPRGSEVLLHCTLAGAYNYPFKKVRIFNCNLEEARGIPD